MNKLFSQSIGTIVGSPGGVLTSIGGGLVGGFVADILSNRALGNTLKRNMLIKLSNGSPEAIKAIDKMINELPSILGLPSPTSEFRSVIKEQTPINLQKETPSSIERREIQRLNRSNNKQKPSPASAVINSPITKELSDSTIQTKPKKSTAPQKVETPKRADKSLETEASKFKTADDFVEAIKTGDEKDINILGTKTGEPVLLKSYHGTDASFEDFKLQESGVRYSGDGHYFTPSKEGASSYGKKC